MKRLLYPGIIIVIAAFFAAFADTASPRITKNINLNWKFNKANISGSENPAFNDNAWQTVQIPHTFEYANYHFTGYFRGVCWYRKKISVDASYQDKKVFLEFEGAMNVADVWVNGGKAGAHSGGYTPFTIDITDNLTFGSDNLIAVKLDNTYQKLVPPEKDNPEHPWVDYILFGGIYRDVNLIIADKLFVPNQLLQQGGSFAVTTPAVSSSSAIVQVKTLVKNEYTVAKSCVLKTAILDKNGAAVTSMQTTQNIPANGSFLFVQTSQALGNPSLWSPINPYLYTARAEVYNDAALVDIMQTRFGIRSIRFEKQTGFYLNGNKCKLLGVNRHQTFPYIGNALPNRAQYRDARLLKEMGCNFIRLSHYPQDPSFLDACDELGIMVWEETPGWGGYLNSVTWEQRVFVDIKDLIRRDINHPCVIIWGAYPNEMRNESPFEINCQACAKSEDSTRYTSRATNGPSELIFDIMGANWFTPPLPDAPVDAHTVGFINSEYTGHTFPTHRYDTEDRLKQHAQCHETMANEARKAWIAGGTGWCGFDYNTNFNDERGIAYHGVSDFFRIPKFAYYFYQSQAAADNYSGSKHPMVFIQSFSNYAMPSTQTIRVYSNCDQVELFVNGASVGTQAPVTGSRLAKPPFAFTNVNYTSPGTLRADGKIGGIVKATHTVLRPGTASKVALWSDTDTLVADGTDIARVVVSVCDANNTLVRSAANSISVSATAAGKMICDASGPQASGSVTVEGGQLAYLVQAGTTPGEITTTATGTGLTQAQLKFVVLSPDAVRVTEHKIVPVEVPRTVSPRITQRGNRLFIEGIGDKAATVSIMGLNGRMIGSYAVTGDLRTRLSLPFRCGSGNTCCVVIRYGNREIREIIIVTR